MTHLVILGAGGHGAVVADCAIQTGNWNTVSFLDDRYPFVSDVLGWPVVGDLSGANQTFSKGEAFIVAVGDNRSRLTLYRCAIKEGAQGCVIIHPSAVVSSSAEIGMGTVVLANAVINARARVGEAVIINTSATVEHDCQIGDGAHVCPGASLAGGVSVGERAWIGMGATVIQSRLIGEGATVGASAAVIRDVQANETVVGVPARRISKQ